VSSANPPGVSRQLATVAGGSLRATEEVRRWVSGQLELAELDAARPG
jgi:hypothetical protein